MREIKQKSKHTPKLWHLTASNICIILSFTLMSACSLTSNKRPGQLRSEDGQRFEQLKPRSPGKFSDSIEREFSQIENDSIVDLERQRAIKAYEQMRILDQQNPQLIEERRQRLIEQERQAQRRRREKELQSTPPQPQVSQEVQVQEPFKKRSISEQLRIEAIQNVDYFCIQHEDHPKWSEQKSCQEFGMEALSFCKDRYKTRPNVNLINCLRSRLSV